MTTYEVVEGGDFIQLSAKVNNKLEEGWKLQGGIAAYTVMERDGYGTQIYTIWFMQAMIKEIP